MRLPVLELEGTAAPEQPQGKEAEPHLKKSVRAKGLGRYRTLALSNAVCLKHGDTQTYLTEAPRPVLSFDRRPC